jgi:hypothetical protein
MHFKLKYAMNHTLNGRRKYASPELRDDVYLCVQRETVPFAATLMPGGAVRKLG